METPENESSCQWISKIQFPEITLHPCAMIFKNLKVPTLKKNHAYLLWHVHLNVNITRFIQMGMKGNKN